MAVQTYLQDYRASTFSGLALVALLLGGCVTNAPSAPSDPNYLGGGIGEPSVVSGNERYVVVLDRWGFGNKKQIVATNWCKKYERIAKFEARGGDGPGCSGRSSNLCNTYACVK